MGSVPTLPLNHDGLRTRDGELVPCCSDGRCPKHPRCGRPGCNHTDGQHYGHPEARLCLVEGCDCHAFAPAADKVTEQLGRAKARVLQFNAHVVASVDPVAGGWRATADLGLGCAATRPGRSAAAAVLAAVKHALAELEARHA